MHELAVAQHLLELAADHAARNAAAQVTDLYLVIGQLSSIVDESLQFYWTLIVEGTPCEGSVLHFRRTRAVMHCQECDEDYPIESEMTACPRCGGFRVTVATGDEFMLESIDVLREKEWAAR